MGKGFSSTRWRVIDTEMVEMDVQIINVFNTNELYTLKWLRW